MLVQVENEMMQVVTEAVEWELYEVMNPGTDDEVISQTPITVTAGLTAHLIYGVRPNVLTEIRFNTAQKVICGNKTYIIKGSKARG